MPRVQRSALLPYRAADVFAIVKDVRRYPEFLPWCADASVIEASEQEVLAELSLAASGIRETFTTRNLLTPFEKIDMVLVSGPFRSLSGGWTFTRLGDDAGCRVALDMDFQLAGFRSLLGSVFTRVADQMVDAFCTRADELLASA